MSKQISDKPIEEIPFIEVEVDVPVRLGTDQISAWNREVNKFFYGEPLVPLTAKIAQEHKDAAWHVHCGRSVKITMRLYADGSTAVIPQELKVSRSTMLQSSVSATPRPKSRTINENFPLPFPPFNKN